MSKAESLTLHSFAKINLGLAVLGRRSDGFHKIRTIFQTISLADQIDLQWTSSKRTSIEVASSVDIPGDNIAGRAARLVLDDLKQSGSVKISIEKNLPIGGGLGGGSTDAAAILLALPALIGRRIPTARLAAIAAQLGSDVPFFLYGGCAIGAGRGEELYPLSDPAPSHGLLLSPDLKVSTAEAYSALNRPDAAELTSSIASPILERLQLLAWALEVRKPREAWAGYCANDFEEVVFRQYPQLKTLVRKLSRLGAAPARMTGSGAAVFGLFPSRSAVQAAIEKLGIERLPARKAGASPSAPLRVLPFTLLGRSRYRKLWRQQLRAYVEGDTWPPHGRLEQ